MSSVPLSPPRPRSTVARPLPKLRLHPPHMDRFEVLMLIALACLSVWVLGLDLWQVFVNGRIWTGSDGVYQADQMQSMMWIQGIVQHGASPNLYVLVPTSADLFQPLVAISAGLTALGMAPYLALLLWKPVAVLAIFFAVRAYVNRTLSGLWPRRVALVLALFYAWGAVIGDSWIPFWSWGYPFALIALACALGALLAYARDRQAGRVGSLAPLLGALASWLHPWQGETLILILIGSEIVMWRGGERIRLAQLALTVALTALPLLYFAGLVYLDPVWQREREAAISTYPVSDVLAAFWPIVLGALLAYRLRPSSFLELTARVWPLAVCAVFAFSEWKGSGSTHALLGVSVPLAVLAVEGVRSLPWQRLAKRVSQLPRAAVPAAIAALLAALTIPGTIHMMKYAQRLARPKLGNANFIEPSEREALSYLARDPRPGGVLTRFYLGMIVPAQTGRQTYIGDCYWSQPGCARRAETTDKLFEAELPAAQARSFVLNSGARFVLVDCQSIDMTALLSPISSEVHRFGCASVYLIR